MLRPILFLSLIFSLVACGGSPEDAQLKSEQAIDRCSSLVGSCDYYRCVNEERLDCGADGYLLGYGEPYCNVLSSLQYPPAKSSWAAEVHPADGNRWKVEVRRCLQEEMEGFFVKNEAPSCDALRAFAFNSHPDCYTRTVSFCDMNPASVVLVGLNIAPQDLLRAESQKQVRATAAICVRQLNDRLAKSSGFWLRLELIKYRTIWQTIAATPGELGSWLAGFDSQVD